MAANVIGGGIWAPAADSSEPHTTVSESPAPITAPQPPASNPGAEDPTGGIAKDAGGLSSTAGIGSPVTGEEQKGVVGSVLEYAFGKKERTAEEVEAAAPTTQAVTAGDHAADNSSGTYLGAIAAAGGAAVASIIPGMAASHGAEPHAATAEAGHADPVAASSAPADVGGASAVTGDKTLGEKAAEATETAKASASEAVESAANTASAAGESAKQAVSGEEKEEDPEAKEKAKKVSDHEAAIRENKDAIPTAGGEKVGAAHAGESKVIPDVPKPSDSEGAQISSSAGQPDATTADNTAKNTGGAVADTKTLPVVGGKPSESEASSGKPKLMDRLKNKLHIGDKKDKA